MPSPDYPKDVFELAREILGLVLTWRSNKLGWQSLLYVARDVRMNLQVYHQVHTATEEVIQTRCILSLGRHQEPRIPDGPR
jgi:hypothetical protein